MDAKERGITDGDIVEVSNERGRTVLKTKVTDSTRRGVLYSPKGVWRDGSDTRLTVNSLIPSDIRTDIEEGACYNETFVDLAVRN